MPRLAQGFSLARCQAPRLSGRFAAPTAVRTARPGSRRLHVAAYLPSEDAGTRRRAVGASRRVPEASTPDISSPVAEFIWKLRAAWRIFFPEKPLSLSAKEQAKGRLRMVLVADRCGMSPTSMQEMKRTILKALEEYVEVTSEESVEVSISTEPELGTVYSVAIPVSRVKPEVRAAASLEAGEAPDGISMAWDAKDPHSDPSSRFPFGT